MKDLSNRKINKRDVAATVLFAINNIPHTHDETLERFLDLVNATGNFGPVSHRELIHKMILLKKFVPETCDYSLLAVAELLGIPLTAHNFENVHLLLKEINH
jgi:hypothetical protein